MSVVSTSQQSSWIPTPMLAQGAFQIGDVGKNAKSTTGNTSSSNNTDPLPRPCVGSFPPTINHVIAHLKLINYFNRFKLQVNDWDTFVKNGVRRYIWFATILRNKLKQSRSHLDESIQISQFKNSSNSKFCTQNLKAMLPPIDILYVWYTLILKTRSFYETGIRFQFLEFTLLSFPIFQVILSISSSKGYSPSSHFVNNFLIMTDNQIPYDWKYSLTHRIPINCPVCSSKLGSTLLKDFHGNANFSAVVSSSSNCKCRFQGTITLRQLLKRQIYSDIVSNSRPLPLIHQTKSHYLYEVGTTETVDDLDELDKSLKGMLQKDVNRLKLASCTIEAFFASIDVNFEKIYSDFYLEQNLLHLTVPVADPIQVTENWASFRNRDKFVNKMAGATNWLAGPSGRTNCSVANYETFFLVLSESFRFYSLVPLIDIDLVWQTHKLSPYEYIEYSRIRCQNNLIDCEDGSYKEKETEESNVGTTNKNKINFETTCQLYKTTHHKNYSDCRCYYCFKSSRLIKRSQYSPKIEEFCTPSTPCFKISDSCTTIIQSTHFPSRA